MEQGEYSRANERLHTEFLPFQGGKTFTSEDVFNFFQLQKYPVEQGQRLKHVILEILYNKSRKYKKPELEQDGKRYRVIDPTLNEIKWWENTERKTLEINWPYGAEDYTTFGFEESIVVYPGDVIGLAGEGNKGKTTFALNYLINNLDKYPESIYFTSEFNEMKFRDRIKGFDWVNIYDDKGLPRFILAKHEENFQDVIRPKANNIIDWVDMPDEPWKIGQIFRRAASVVTTGNVFIVMQKRSYKTFAVGGESAMDYASAFFTITYDKGLNSNVLKVEKVKTPGTVNPNYKKFRFGIEKGGAKLFGIEEIKEY